MSDLKDNTKNNENTEKINEKTDKAPQAPQVPQEKSSKIKLLAIGIVILIILGAVSVYAFTSNKPKPKNEPLEAPENRRPYAKFVVIGDTYVNEPIRFDASSSYDPDDDKNGNKKIDANETDHLSYLWNFDDGTTNTQKNTTHTYSEAKTYTVILTVSDGEFNATKTQRVIVNVRENAATPTVTLESTGLSKPNPSDPLHPIKYGRITVTVSAPPERLDNFTFRIIDNETGNELYSNLVVSVYYMPGTTPGNITFYEFPDANIGNFSQGDYFTITPDSGLPVESGDAFILHYGPTNVDCCETILKIGPENPLP